MVITNPKARMGLATLLGLCGIAIIVAIAVEAHAGTTIRTLDTFQISCSDSAATEITTTTLGDFSTLRCWNGSVSGGVATTNTDVVCVGNSNVSTTTKCYPLCATSSGCPESALTWDVKKSGTPYCISASGSAETITCQAGG